MYIIGENIHIISQSVKDALRDRDAKFFQELAVRQVEAGAQALDLNLGPRKKDWEEVFPWMVKTVEAVSPGRRLDLTVERGDRQLSVAVDVQARGKHRTGWTGADVCLDVLLGRIADGGAAAQAGLRTGDHVESVDGSPVCNYSVLTDAIQSAEGRPVVMSIARGEERFDASVSATWNKKGKKWLIGVGIAETLPRSLAYSISPFPLGRELIVLLVIWLLLLRRGIGWRTPLICLLVMFDGLMFLRLAGADWRNPIVMVQWWGFAQVVIPIAILLFVGCRVGRTSEHSQAAGAAT